MILYHGTLSLFNDVDVTKGKGYKDFGKGFYLTQDKHHAIRLVERNRHIELERRKRLKMPSGAVPMYLYEFELDLLALETSDVRIKRFDANNIMEWVEFILQNRSSPIKSHDYDVVIGATADDDTRLSLDTYQIGGFGDIGSDSAKLALIAALKLEIYPEQIYFGEQRAVSHLRLIERRVI